MVFSQTTKYNATQLVSSIKFKLIPAIETDPQQEKVTPTPTSTPITPYSGATARGLSSRVCMDASTHYVHSPTSMHYVHIAICCVHASTNEVNFLALVQFFFLQFKLL